MDVGAILSRSFSLYKRNLNLILPHLVEYSLDLVVLLTFGIFAAIVLALSLGSVTLGSVMSLMYGPISFFLIAFAIFAIVALFLIFILFNAFARAAIIGMVIEARKNGKTSLNTGLKSAKKHGLGIFGYMLAISIVPLFAVGVIISVLLAITFFAGGVGAGADTGMGFMAFIIFIALLGLIVYVIIYVLALFSPQKIVVEKRGTIDGIRSSFDFVRKNAIGVLIYIGFAVGVVVLTSLISMVLAVPEIVFKYSNYFIATFFKIFENIVSITIGLIVAPYVEAVKTLMVMEAGDEMRNEVEKSPVL